MVVSLCENVLSGAGIDVLAPFKEVPMPAPALEEEEEEANMAKGDDFLSKRMEEDNKPIPGPFRWGLLVIFMEAVDGEARPVNADKTERGAFGLVGVVVVAIDKDCCTLSGKGASKELR